MRTRAIRIIAILLLAFVLLVSGVGIAGAVAKANLAKKHPAHGQLVDAGGHKMHINCGGQGGPTAQKQAATQPAGSVDPRELELFLDGLVSTTMAENYVPGAVVIVVKDSSTLLAKGYGYADLETEEQVDPESTLFRIASVSKLLTWTAVMQLVEEGKLALDTDINEYLDFTIPNTFPEPITLSHLLSHTAGFEDRGFNIWKLRVEDMSPLGDFLKENIPARILPPGEASGYSNYGASLAGYIVERVSGVPFSEYVEQNIFIPLGMVHSSFQQPLPEILAADLAKGYNYSNGQYIAGSFEFLQTAPGGAASAAATDMARFMIAHLRNGELEGQRILQEGTAIQMHSQLYTPDPRLANSMAHGFLIKSVNGQRVIWHDGASFLFHSGLYLIPDQNVGLFISTNGTGGDAVVEAISDAFLNHLYPPVVTPDPKPAAGFADRIAPYLGEYTMVRSNFTSFEKMGRLVAPVNARLGSDDLLKISGLGPERRFAEVEPGLLQEIDKPATQLVFRTGSEGQRFLMNGNVALFRTPWYGTAMLHRILFLSGSLLFLGALIVWPVGYVIGRRKSTPEASPVPLPARLARWAAALFGLLLLACLLGFGAIFADILPGFGAPRIFFETPPLLSLLVVLSYVVSVLGLVILVFAVLAWVRRYWGLGGRIFFSLLALMALLLTWSLAYWDLIL